MNVIIVRSEKYSERNFQKLKNILLEFNSPIIFECHSATFEENVEIWTRNELFKRMNTFRKTYNIPGQAFLIFLTTVVDELKWFSACSKLWDKNIFINSSNWESYTNIEQSEYPVAYEIVENVLQYLMSDNYEEYEKLDSHPTLGCINDMCLRKRDVIFKITHSGYM